MLIKCLGKCYDWRTVDLFIELLKKELIIDQWKQVRVHEWIITGNTLEVLPAEAFVYMCT